MSMILSESVNIILNIGNTQDFSSNLFVFLTHFVQLMKTLQVYRYQSKLMNLINKIERPEFSPKTVKQQTILNKYIRMSKAITTIFIIACFGTCFLWGVGPLTDATATLPLAGWYPWKTNISPNFELTFMYQIIAVTLNGLANINMDTLISGM